MLVSLTKTYSQGSKTEVVRIIKNHGDTIEFSTSIKYFQYKYIFPDDNKDFIKGKIADEKIKLPKKDISKILLTDGSIYSVIPNKSGYVIGYYVSKGKVDFFKSYSFGRQNYYIPNTPYQTSTYGNTTYYGQPYGTSQSINKVVTESFFIMENDLIKSRFINKNFESISTDCPKFEEFLKSKKRIKAKEVEATIILFNNMCGSI